MQDSYMGSGISRSHHNYWENNLFPEFRRDGLDSTKQGNTSSVTARHKIIRNKSLCGIPFRIAVKLIQQRYIWRELIIWDKPNPMPENVKDRVRQSAEYILHFTKQGKYKFNPEPMMVLGKSGKPRMDDQVWEFAPEPKKGHTATFPSKIVRRLLLAATDPGDTVFEPFLGSGTMMDICLEEQRNFVGCDINKAFVEQASLRVNSPPAPKRSKITDYLSNGT
jgi:DNA modification methylase